MPKLLLVRHGQASFGAADYDRLSALGERQAELAAAELARRGETPARLVSGTLLRQRQTAQAFTSLAGLAASEDPRWNEYDSADVLTAHPPSDPAASDLRAGASSSDVPAVPRTMSSRDFQTLLEAGISAWAAAGDSSTAAEPWRAFRARADAALDAATAELGSGETGVVCTSGGVIAAIGTTLLGGDLPTFLRLNRTAINAGITTVISGSRGHSLLAYNEHPHLVGDEPGLVTFR